MATKKPNKTTKELIADLQTAISVTKKFDVLSRRIQNLTETDQVLFENFAKINKLDDLVLHNVAAENLKIRISEIQKEIESSEGNTPKTLKIDLQRCESMAKLHEVFSQKYKKTYGHLQDWIKKHSELNDNLVDAPINFVEK